jgi:hypothetical protein
MNQQHGDENVVVVAVVVVEDSKRARVLSWQCAETWFQGAWSFVHDTYKIFENFNLFKL